MTKQPSYRPLSLLTNASVITVPGYSTPPSSNWGVARELEEAALPVDSVSQLHLYTYEPTIDSGVFSWESFMKRGSDLAEDLARLATEVDIHKRPNHQLLEVPDEVG